MSMRPVDLQMIAPRATEVASLQGSESARQLTAAQHSAESAKAMVDADTREVHSKKTVQAVTMRTDREREKDGRGKGGNRRGRSSSGRQFSGGTEGANIKDDGPDANGNRHIDIRL